MRERFSRQSFLGMDSNQVLHKAKVAIVGLGGGGSHIVQQLAHLGVGNFLLIDPDVIEESNLNRLVGGRSKDVSSLRTKTFIAKRLIKGINPTAKVLGFQKQWSEVAEHLRDRDVIFGCLDTFQGRWELEITAKRYLIPYIDIGMDVHEEGGRFLITGQVIASLPGQPCLKCLGFLTEELLAQEARRYGVAGSKPQVVWSNGILASFAVGLFVQLFTPWHEDHSPIAYLEYDGNNHTVRKSNRMWVLDLIHCNCFMDPQHLGDPFLR